MYFEGCQKIIDDFINNNDVKDEIHVTLSINAASFKDTRSQTISQNFFDLNYIEPQKIYNNIFVFFVQPINVDLKPFPIHIALKENGTASNQIISIIGNILKNLKNNHIHVDFVATDGDHKYEELHDEFFEIIFNLYKSNITFKQIIEYISNSKVIQIPISDFLHLLKILRCNLVKCGLVTDYKNSTTVTKESLIKYDMGKSLFDTSTHGKMKDQYPIEIFSSKNIIEAIKKNDYSFIFYSLPFNLLINAIRNPDISYELRLFNFECSFYFLLHYLYQFNESVAPLISRIGLIRTINTVIGISIALHRYDFVQLGHIGTHPLENYFGSLRIACHCDHS